jgi:hypothetical protein
VPISRILLVHRRFVGDQRAKRRSRRKMIVEAHGTRRWRGTLARWRTSTERRHRYTV